MLHFMEILSNVVLCFVVMYSCRVEKGVPDLFVTILLHIFICLLCILDYSCKFEKL